jgi:DNA-binding response OmpR family regulator
MSQSKPLILIADDDLQIRTGLGVRLTKSGFDIVTVGDGASALSCLEKRAFDAAVLDVQMPAMDGFAVCERMREIDVNIPVVFLTGTSKGVIRDHLSTLTKTVGGNYFLTKPYDGKVLSVMLRDAINQSAAPHS